MPETPAAPIDLDLAAALGAVEDTLADRITLYLPNKDRVGKKVTRFRRWVEQARELLTELNGGSTTFPPVEGSWQESPDADPVWEDTVVVYSFIRPAAFLPGRDFGNSCTASAGRRTRAKLSSSAGGCSSASVPTTPNHEAADDDDPYRWKDGPTD